MDSEYIADDELLYRAVVGPQGALIEGSPHPALFIDDNGLSVDRDGGRSDPEVLRAFSRRFRKQGCSSAVKIKAADCRNAGTCPMPIGNARNKYHAEIHDSESVVPISLAKAMALAHNCQFVQL